MPPTSARRRASYDDVSFSPPRERPREWAGDEKFVRCQQGHVLNYVVTLQVYRQRFTELPPYVVLFVRCEACKPCAHQVGVWNPIERLVVWHVLPSAEARSSMEDWAHRITKAALAGEIGPDDAVDAIVAAARQTWDQP